MRHNTIPALPSGAPLHLRGNEAPLGKRSRIGSPAGSLKPGWVVLGGLLSTEGLILSRVGFVRERYRITYRD
jgi:hypothetical protein